MTSRTLPYSRSIVHRSPVFYGWVIALVAMIGMWSSMPGQSATVSLFIDGFIADFGLDRTTVSGLYGLGTFIASFSLTWVGRQIDHYGNRRVGVIVAGLLAISLFGMSLVNGPITLLIGFIAIRALGQGSTFLVHTTVIAQWFRSRRGQVMSIALIGFALFQTIYIPQLQQILETTHWRQVWVLLAAGIAITIVPLSWLLIRNRPEDYGLSPDGHRVPIETDESETIEDNWTLREAMRTPIFWIFALAHMLPPAWGTGLILHQISIFGELGYAPQVAANTYGSISLIVAVSVLISGYLIDRLHPSIIIITEMLIYAFACWMATMMTASWMLVVYALLFGAGMGIGQVFSSVVWTNLFGRLHQGSVRGFVSTLGIIGAAIGPIVFGVSFDYLGGYAPVLWLGAGLFILAAIASVFARKPQRKQKITPAT